MAVFKFFFDSNEKLASFTGFYQVLMSFIGFYRVLLASSGLTEFYRVLLGSTSLQWQFTSFSLIFFYFYLVLPSFFYEHGSWLSCSSIISSFIGWDVLSRCLALFSSSDSCGISKMFPKLSIDLWGISTDFQAFSLSLPAEAATDVHCNFTFFLFQFHGMALKELKLIKCYWVSSNFLTFKNEWNLFNLIDLVVPFLLRPHSFFLHN